MINKATPIALLASAILSALPTVTAQAHELPWRPGESRQVGYGYCAKGPCQKRTCWAPNRPHQHVGDRVEISKYGTPECWRSASSDDRG